MKNKLQKCGTDYNYIDSKDRQWDVYRWKREWRAELIRKDKEKLCITSTTLKSIPDKIEQSIEDDQDLYLLIMI
jgi:hypothetical protein